MRGSGDSEGFYYDEYEKQEQDDCCDVINWVSQQPWCTGNVGRLDDLKEGIVLFSRKTREKSFHSAVCLFILLVLMGSSQFFCLL